MLTVTPTDIPAVKIVEPKRFGDSRGYFVETWNKKRFAEHGLDLEFVQDNESLSAQVGTVRGLHFQKHPNAQDKLVRVLRGRVFDVAVDLRKSSPSYGKHVAVELSAENGRQLLIPIGFAHGFCTLEPDVEVALQGDGLLFRRRRSWACLGRSRSRHSLAGRSSRGGVIRQGQAAAAV